MQMYRKISVPGLFRAKKTRVRLFCGPKFRERGFWKPPPVGGFPAIKLAQLLGFGYDPPSSYLAINLPNLLVR